jgi:IS4 transposase
MSRRVEEREWVQFQWPYMLTLLGGKGRVEELAYETGAFTRRRAIRSPTDVLQMILIWAVAERSLRETAMLAAEAGLADVSNVALFKRFGKAGKWLTSLLMAMIADHPIREMTWGPRIRVIDATAISRPGHQGTDLRVHLSMQLGTNRSDSIELTDGRGAESLDRFTFKAGELVLADSAYAHRDPLARVAAGGAFFVVRPPWSFPLENRDGTKFDLFDALGGLPEARPGEFAVQFRGKDGRPTSCRLVAIRRTEQSAAHERERVAKNSKRHGAKAIDLRTLEYAGYVCLITNAPPELSCENVLDLFRFRWQIEMRFKDLKSVLHLADVPARSPELLEVYVLAKLLVAVVIENLSAAESFFPWGYPIPANQLVASGAVDS